MSNGKFAFVLVAGLVGCFVVAELVTCGLGRWIGADWARMLGMLCAASLGAFLGTTLVRAGDRRSESRRSR